MITLRVNTNTRLIQYEELNPDYLNFGNRGLIARAALDEIPPACDPLGPENKLLIAQSTLAGTIVSTSGRMSIGAKSPLTNGIKESNIGGMIGKALSAHGIKLLIVEGTPSNDTLFILLVEKDGSAQLIARSDLAGMGNFSLVDQLRKEYGPDSEMLVCGPAGEKLYRNACILSTDFATKELSRAAGRGGLGAVMGARRLKAIVVQKAAKPFKAQPTDPEKFKSAAVSFHKSAAGNGAVQARTKYGTFGGVRNNADTGILPVKNFRSIPFEGIDKIDAQAIVDHLDRFGGKYGLACQSGCLIKCSNYFVDSNGEHTASSFNYETLGLLGPNLMIDSLDDVALIKQVCDDAGIDTIEMGAALGVLMEAGILEWGDGKAAIAMVQQLITGGKYAKEFAQGIDFLGKFLKVERIPAVRGQSFPAYDIRNNKGMGLSYLAGTMGADHTFGSGRPDEDGSYVKASVMSMNMLAGFDNIFCLFMMQPIMMDKAIQQSFFDLLSAYYGEPWDLPKLIKLGAETLSNEYKFNQLAGLDDPVMPRMFTQENSEISGTIFDVEDEQITNIKKNYLEK